MKETLLQICQREAREKGEMYKAITDQLYGINLNITFKELDYVAKKYGVDLSE
jgi:hypothetical protein